jgi:hypothetical protein
MEDRVYVVVGDFLAQRKEGAEFTLSISAINFLSQVLCAKILMYQRMFL